MRTGRFASTAWLVFGLTTLVAVGCDKVQLTAPVNSTITLTTPVRMLPTGGTTELTAQVVEPAGTPVQNGTTVRFTSSLGRVDPVETQTRNGIATATFYAGDVSGSAEVKVSSGGSTPSTGTGTTATTTNAVTILIGAAAVDSISVRASPGSVPATGGTTTIVATVYSVSGVTGVSGGPLGGIPVSFSTTAGTLSGTREVTDGNGEAQTRLTTDANATVTANAGTKSATVAIQALNPVPTPTLTLAAVAGTENNGGLTSTAQLFTFTATVANNTAVGTPSKFEWTFGDGTSAETNGPSVTHAYTVEKKVYTATVKAIYPNGMAQTASTDIVTATFPLP
jgi:hypothetical protein